MQESKITIESVLALQEEAFNMKDLPWPCFTFPYAYEPYYKFLYLLCRKYQPKVMVELGTWEGTASYHMAWGSPLGHLYTVDINAEAAKRLESKMLMNTTFVLGDSREVADKLPAEIDLLFIDTIHDYDLFKAEYNLYHDRVKQILLFDDIHFQTMGKVFEEVVRGNKVELPKLHWSGFGAEVI